MVREYHSLRKAGTEYTPQWRKMPSFASWYHRGGVYRCRDSQVGSNGPRLTTSSTACSAAELSLTSTAGGSWLQSCCGLSLRGNGSPSMGHRSPKAGADGGDELPLRGRDDDGADDGRVAAGKSGGRNVSSERQTVRRACRGVNRLLARMQCGGRPLTSVRGSRSLVE